MEQWNASDDTVVRLSRLSRCLCQKLPKILGHHLSRPQCVEEHKSSVRHALEPGNEAGVGLENC